MDETRIVFDTNFWIALFISGKQPEFAKRQISHYIVALSSDQLIKEMTSVFHEHHIFKRKLFPPFDEYIQFHKKVTTWIDVEPRSGFIHDYKDNFIYDLCIQSRAQYLVTNDSDFDILKTYRARK